MVESWVEEDGYWEGTRWWELGGVCFSTSTSSRAWRNLCQVGLHESSMCIVLGRYMGGE